MQIRRLITIYFSKAVYWVLRKRGRHGAALPGLIAERLCPSIIEEIRDLPEGVIIVSGTNGKTTTTYLVTEVLRRSGRRVFTNHSGSNMTRGLLSSIIRFSDYKGQLNYDVAVLEIDEAYAAKLAPILRPVACILTNVLRDQLDRFGEIDHAANLLNELANNCQKLVVYNGSDARLNKLKRSGKVRYVSYGFDPSLSDHFPDDDALYQNKRIRELPSSYNYTLTQANDRIITVSSGDHRSSFIRSELSGWHNALNLTSTYALVRELYKVEDPAILSNLKPPYGRGEMVTVNGGNYTLQLVKNPAGFRTSMDVLPNQPALLIINDNIADGRDVSWLWDVDVNRLSNRPEIYCGGTRAHDIQNRLKYADISVAHVDRDESTVISKFINSHKNGVIFLTYTAMLNSRKILRSLQVAKS